MFTGHIRNIFILFNSFSAGDALSNDFFCYCLGLFVSKILLTKPAAQLTYLMWCELKGTDIVRFGSCPGVLASSTDFIIFIYYVCIKNR